MTATLTSPVKLFDGFPPGSGLITINDDNTFVLSKLDPSTKQPVATIISTPINQLSVRGRATRLTFSAGSVRRAVDFSLTSEFVGSEGLIGDVVGGVLAGRSGVKPVVAALRKGGAQVRYLTYWQRRALIWAIALGFVIVILLIVVLSAFAQR